MKWILNTNKFKWITLATYTNNSYFCIETSKRNETP